MLSAHAFGCFGVQFRSLERFMSLDNIQLELQPKHIRLSYSQELGISGHAEEGYRCLCRDLVIGLFRFALDPMPVLMELLTFSYWSCRTFSLSVRL